MNRTQAFLKEFRERMGLFGTPEGRQRKYDESKKSFLGMPLPEFGVSEFLGMPDASLAKENQENKRIQKEKKRRKELGLDNDGTSKPPSFKDIMGIGVKDYIGEIAKIGEEAKNKEMLRSGISSLAYSPSVSYTHLRAHET